MGKSHSGLVEGVLSGGGFYSWSLTTNRLTADAAFAAIYEISEADLARGIPVESILERIVAEDRPRLAERIHDVILGGKPFVSPYRIMTRDGRIRSLLSMGSCANDQDGVPSTYSGIVLIAKEVEVTVKAAGLKMQIETAIDLAKKEGLELTERYLSSALRSLSSKGS
ncbi:PAS domain-containing protein [Neorhizobium sp. AL 9.2.2]|uniref:PAS domain-containing protein n=1 Tax=Neorhizobium sp. AL 9.2.2 TaxID=2712894 RepID=UPI001573915E|nr:PAS domain-containing protein [Neorhizobium sp. AL 9.2.2]NSY20185.1 PAS domain-containing protein [Neorhizobium sp. AL 9.2.2]